MTDMRESEKIAQSIRECPSAFSVKHGKPVTKVAADLIQEQAAEITRLSEEVERLKGDLLKAGIQIEADLAMIDAETSRAEAAEKEVERLEREKMMFRRARNDAEVRAEAAEARIKELEEALRNIAEGNLGGAPWQASYERVRETAHAALAEKEG